MIPTSEELERHPFLGTVMIVALSTLIVVGIVGVALRGRPLDLGMEIDWEKVIPVIIKFAAEILVAAYSVFRLLKPIEARLAVVEAKLDLMRTSRELRRILTETE